MTHGLRFLVAGLMIAPAVFAFADEGSAPTTGFKFGVFFPNDSLVRNALGKEWTSFGLQFGRVQQGKRVTAFDADVISRSANGNRLFLGTLTYGIVFPLGEADPMIGARNNRVRPYAAVRAGGTYADYRIGTFDDSKLLFNANAELGVTIGNNLNLAFRYDLINKTDGLNFSGSSITLRYTLISF